MVSGRHKSVWVGTFVVWLAAAACADAGPSRPNILMVVADDLNWDSVGCYGSPVPDVTPHIDRLAAAGLRFGRGHVTVAACQPSRSVWMTGLYPFHNGASGFEPIDPSVPTLVEALGEAGYFNGILGKVKHLEPVEKFPWAHEVPSTELGFGRDVELYYQATRGFLASAKKKGRPFFLMANSHDPKRPFAGSEYEVERPDAYPPPPRVYAPDEVEVPAFLPDLPDVRKEVAQYFTSVHRFDAILGEILRALADEGMERDTVILFMSDHGMPFPFAKMNCYLASTKIPFIVKWPGVVEGGAVDEEHFVSGVDVMPTLLEIAGVTREYGTDGRSFAPLLRGDEQKGRGRLMTVFEKTGNEQVHRMRALNDGRYGYIYNAWSDGKKTMQTESMSGLTFPAMVAAAASDRAIASRVALLLYRCPEELYDYSVDPDALVNLAVEPEYGEVLQRMRAGLLDAMRTARDPLQRRFGRFLGK